MLNFFSCLFLLLVLLCTTSAGLSCQYSNVLKQNRKQSSNMSKNVQRKKCGKGYANKRKRKTITLLNADSIRHFVWCAKTLISITELMRIGGNTHLLKYGYMLSSVQEATVATLFIIENFAFVTIYYRLNTTLKTVVIFQYAVLLISCYNRP